MVGEGWDWCMGSKMVTTTCFSVTVGVEVGWTLLHCTSQGWVSLDLFRQFTASQPFQYLIISIMNGFARLRLEFIMYKQHHTMALHSLVAASRLAPVPLQYPNTAVHAAGPRCERSAAVSTAVEGLTSQHCSSTAVEGSFFGYIPIRIHYVSRHCSGTAVIWIFWHHFPDTLHLDTFIIQALQ